MAVNQLKRFIFLSTDAPSFTSGDSEYFKHYELDKVPFIKTLLKESPDEFFATIESTIADPLLPTTNSILFILAVASTLETDSKLKNQIYQCVHKYTKNDEDFFAYIKFKTKLKKSFSSGLMKIIEKHYLDKTPDELWKTLGFQTKYHGWSHKDLMKLSHINTKVKYIRLGINYAMKGYEAALKEAEDDEAALKVLEQLEKCRQFRQGKDINDVVQLLKELQFGHRHVPDKFAYTDKVWEILLDYIDIKDVIPLLHRLYKAGLLAKNSPIASKIVTMLNDPKQIAKSNIQPSEAYIGYQNFIRGGKPTDPQFLNYLEIQAKESSKRRKIVSNKVINQDDVVDALKNTISLSTVNVLPIKKWFMITVTLEEIKNCCITSKNLNCLDAAAIIVYELLKGGADIKLFVRKAFGKPIVPISLDESETLDTLLKKLLSLEELTAEQIKENSYKTQMDYVDKENKVFDVYMYIHYKKDFKMCYNTVKKPNTKLIVCNFGWYKVDSFPEDILDVHGFDKNTMNIIRAFVWGRF